MSEMNKNGNRNDNDRRFIQIGLKVAYYRKLNGYTQEQFAEIVGMSPEYLSQVEAPNFVQPISLKTLFAIADACEVSLHRFFDVRRRVSVMICGRGRFAL